MNDDGFYIVSRLHVNANSVGIRTDENVKSFSRAWRIPKKENKKGFKSLSFSTNNFYLNDLISYCSRFEEYAGLREESVFQLVNEVTTNTLYFRYLHHLSCSLVSLFLLWFSNY